VVCGARRYNDHMAFLDGCKVDRRATELSELGSRSNDRQYWLSKTPAERFEALEILRQIAYEYDPDTARLQRVLEVTQLDKR
jgi:hypothetical protein